MHGYRMRSTEAKNANERNLARFRKLASEARTPAEERKARLLLNEQEAIARALARLGGKANLATGAKI